MDAEEQEASIAVSSTVQARVGRIAPQLMADPLDRTLRNEVTPRRDAEQANRS